MKERNSKNGPEVKPPGLRNDFSEQEAEMTKEAAPPPFALTADPVAPPASPLDDGTNSSALSSLGLSEEEIAALDGTQAAWLLAVSKRFSSTQWTELRTAVTANELQGWFVRILRTFYEQMVWITDQDATSLALMPDMPYPTSGGMKTGHVELVRKGERVGMRAVVPYEGFGGNLILDPHKTSTVLGRSVEASTKEEFGEKMNDARGTNYMRFQKNMKVGKSTGGGNVLDVADKAWSWPLNNAWLQASVDRGDKLKFVSDPTKASTLFRRGGSIKDGLTVTGMELGVLMHKGYAPDTTSGEVKKGYLSDDDDVLEKWFHAKNRVEETKEINQIDRTAYSLYLNGSEDCVRSPKQYFDPEGNLVATQTNFFGGEAAA